MGVPEKREHHSTCSGRYIECKCGTYDYNKGRDAMLKWIDEAPIEETISKSMLDENNNSYGIIHWAQAIRSLLKGEKQ